MPVYGLPMRNDVSALQFDENSPRELASYFGVLECLFDRHMVENATERKQPAVRIFRRTCESSGSAQQHGTILHDPTRTSKRKSMPSTLRRLRPSGTRPQN